MPFLGPIHLRAPRELQETNVIDEHFTYLVSEGADERVNVRHPGYGSSHDLLFSHQADAEDNSRFDSQVDSQASFYAESVNSGSGRSSGKLVENPLYRPMHLASNNIYLRSRREQFPEHISSLIDHVGKDRDSPGPSANGLLQDEELEALGVGAPEADVQTYFQSKVFSRSAGTLKRSDRLPMAKRAVPQLSDPALNISTPVPDLLFGYSRDKAFPQQQTQLVSMGAEMVANSQDLLYPFFIIEFKADGPSGVGSLWVAENQGLGGSVSCVKTAELLNKRLRECKNEKVELIDSAAFFIAMNGTEARLYVSWKSKELDYYAKQVNSFLVQKPTEYVEFRKHVLNIIGWAKDKRLTQIQKSLDDLLEEGRRKTSEAAKSRRPPSDGSASSSSRKCRTLPGKGKPPTNSKKGRAKGSASSVGDGNPWEWDDEMKANKTWDQEDGCTRTRRIRLRSTWMASNSNG